MASGRLSSSVCVSVKILTEQTHQPDPPTSSSAPLDALLSEKEGYKAAQTALVAEQYEGHTRDQSSVARRPPTSSMVDLAVGSEESQLSNGNDSPPSGYIPQDTRVDLVLGNAYIGHSSGLLMQSIHDFSVSIPSDTDQESRLERIGRAVNVFTGAHFGSGYITQTIQEVNLIEALPIHPGIDPQLSGYFPNSRIDEERNIFQWLDTPRPLDPALYVSGEPGMGKSTFAKHLADELRKADRLAGEVYLEFIPKNWNVEKILKMLIGQICKAFPSLVRPISGKLLSLTSHFILPIDALMNLLILEPIRSLRLAHPVALILDLIPQWPSLSHLEEALSCLGAHNLYPLRLIVFGSPSSRDQFQRIPMTQYQLLRVGRDLMENYIREQLQQTKRFDTMPSHLLIRQLAERADGSFRWVAELGSFLQDELSCPDPHGALSTILQPQLPPDNLNSHKEMPQRTSTQGSPSPAMSKATTDVPTSAITIGEERPKSPSVTFKTVGNLFSGINDGHLIQEIDVLNVINNLPNHPDIEAHIDDCLPGSRVEDEKRVLEWIDEDDTGTTLCVLGKIGIGKSSLAKSIAQRLRHDRQLAAAVFFGHATPEWTEVFVIQMIAGQICKNFPQLSRQIAEAIRLDVGPSLPRKTRFKNLILDPIRSLKLPVPLIILLDALDQWKGHPGIIEALEGITAQPSAFRFVVFGRPGYETFFDKICVTTYVLPPVSVQAMFAYFETQFALVVWKGCQKPDDRTIIQLVDRADGIFAWCSLLCAFLKTEKDSSKILSAALRPQRDLGSSSILSSLYHNALTARFPRAGHRSTLMELFGALLVLQEPLSIDSFSLLISLDQSLIRRLLLELKLFQVHKTQESQEIIRPAMLTFHSSFLEYLHASEGHLTDPFSVDICHSHSRLGEACLRELNQLLSPEFGFTSPLHKYAVKYWSLHTAQGTPSVTRASDDEWKATSHYTLLALLPPTQWQRWVAILSQLMYPELSLNADSISVGPGASYGAAIMSKVTRALIDADCPGGIVHAISVADIALRLANTCPERWNDLKELQDAFGVVG